MLKRASVSRSILSQVGFLGSAMAMLFALQLSGVQIYGNSLQAATSAELDRTYGGDCFSCLSQPYCATAGFACKAAGAVWIKGTGFNITQVFCNGGATSGYKGCRTQTPKDCISVVTCTDNKCTNCGTPATEQKDTECNFIPYAPCGS